MATRYPSIQSLFREGLDYHRQGKLQEASDVYSKILNYKPDFTPAMNNIALIARDMGRLDLAYRMLQESLRYDGDNLETLANTGLVAMQNRDFNGAEFFLRRALERKPDHFDLRLKLGMAIYGQAKYPDAGRIFRALLKQQPKNFDLLYNLGVVLIREGQVDEALGFLHRALEIRPGDITTLNQLAEQWLLRRDLDQADRFLQLSLATPGMNNRALALQAVLFNLRQDEAALQQLYAYEQLLQSRPVQVAEAFGSSEEFNRQLLACIDTQVSMQQNPEGLPTVNGLHSASVTHIKDPVMAEMNRLIAAGLKHALAGTESLASHPILAWYPQRQFLDSWVIRLRTGGYQRPHTHPMAWLSGCYYLQVPDEVHGDASKRPGWIGFGEPDAKYGVANPLARNAREPKVGDLLTFPSFYWHHTIPFESDQERISLAFDIYPG